MEKQLPDEQKVSQTLPIIRDDGKIANEKNRRDDYGKGKTEHTSSILADNLHVVCHFTLTYRVEAYFCYHIHLLV